MSASLDALPLPAGVELRRHEPLEVDGMAVEATLVPEDAESLAATLGVLGEAGLAALPRGAGSQIGLGNTPRRGDGWLSTERLRRVEELDAEEGVCRAGAGTPLAALRARVEEAGWELPLDDAGRGGTLGGALATAALAPRAQGLGLPRDVVLGLDVALADGSLARCGGRVVKNVTGYDLAKLYLGSLGALGVICAAWLRLRPRPEARQCLAGAPLDDAAACSWALEWSRRGALRSIFFADSPDGLAPWIELAGDAASVAASAGPMQSEGLRPAEPAVREALLARAFEGAAAGSRFRISTLPSRLGACVAELRRARAELCLLPGLNLVCARFGSAAEDPFLAAERAARAGGGRFLCEWATPERKAGRDVFAALAGEVALARRLKQQFDPAGVLNPGRHAGRV